LNSIDAFVTQNIGLVAVVLGLFAVAALAGAAFSVLRLQSITRPFAWLSGQWDGDTDSLPALLQTVEKNAKDIDAVRATLENVIVANRAHFKRVGFVRYDAFDGIAGQQSYSLCILDDNRNGFVLSSLVGRDFARSYAIEIAEGEAPRKLGQEEGQALELALNRVVG
jgi:hypothetical protein